MQRNAAPATPAGSEPKAAHLQAIFLGIIFLIQSIHALAWPFGPTLTGFFIRER